MTDRELLQQALDSLEWAERRYSHANLDLFNKPIEAIRTRLAQPEPKPVAWEVWTIHNHIFFSIGVQSFQINDVLEHQPEVLAEEFSEWLATQLRHALTQLSNTVPPKKEWVGLTDEEVEKAGKLNIEGDRMLLYSFAKAIEAKLKEKNNA